MSIKPIDPKKVEKGYTFPMLCKLLQSHKSEVIYDSEFINGLIVKAIESTDSDVETLAEMNFFLDRYFSELSHNLYISPDDLSLIIWHFLNIFKRIAQSNVILSQKGNKSKSKQSNINESEIPPEDADYSSKLAIDAATSLLTNCSHLVTVDHYKTLVVCVVSELLLVNEQRLDGLSSLPGRPYVTEGTRESLLLLLQTLAQMPKYPEHNPLKVALTIFDKFCMWEKSLSIRKTCKLSSQILMTMCRSTSHNCLSSTAETNVIINPLQLDKPLSPILEEPVSPFQSSPKDSIAQSTNESGASEHNQEEKREDEKQEEGRKDSTVVDAVISNEDNRRNQSLQAGNISSAQRHSRSASESTCYLTAVDLCTTDDDDDVTLIGNTNLQTEMDLTILSPPTLNKTQNTTAHNQTTFQEENMSLEKTAFHHTADFEENKLLGNHDFMMPSNTNADETDMSTSPAKRFKEDKQVDENVDANEGDSMGLSSIFARGTYTLLPTETALTSQPVPNLVDDPIVESVEDILKSANFDE